MEDEIQTATGEVTNMNKAMRGLQTATGLVYFKPGQTRTVTITEAQGERALKLGFVPVAPVEAEVVKPAEPVDRDDLKKQADELGIEYAKNIPTDKLKELIDAKLAE